MSTKPLQNTDGEPFAILFTAGLPAPLAGPSLFVTKDGAVHSGALIWNGERQFLRTTNPADGLHTLIDIPASRVIGHAPCGPRML